MDKKFIDQLEVERGIDVNVLPAGTKLNIETHHSVYQIEIINGKKITILGGMLLSGEYRFPTPASAVLIGSVLPDLIKLDWVVKGTQMIIDVGEGNILTSPVTNLEFEN